jgi:hypothetical protein
VSKGDKIRTELFNTYSRNWELVKDVVIKNLIVTVGYEEGVVCPLCMKLFNRDGLRQIYNDSLTLEHIIPENLGGKKTILLCRKCNNETGGRVDNSYKEYQNAVSLLKKEDGASLDVNVLIGDSLRSRGLLTYDKEKDGFSLDSIMDKYSYDKLKTIYSPTKPIKLDLKFKSPTIQKAHVNLLKIAYLLAFQRLGYAYIMPGVHNIVRDQINNPTIPVIEKLSIITPFSQNYTPGVYVVVEPKELTSLLVVFKIKIKNRTETKGVLLPSLLQKYSNLYSILATIENDKSIQLKVRDMPSVNYLTDPEFADKPFWIWTEFL